MKEFNLEEAKAGKPVCTRSGRSARIICFDRIDKEYPIIVLVKFELDEDFISCSTDGRIYVGENNEYDLMMVSEKKTGWINIYKHKENLYPSAVIHESKEKAIEFRSPRFVNTIEIEWEE